MEPIDIADRVQIVPLGYEKSRVLDPINELKADKVILIRHTSDEDYEADFQRELVTELETNDRIELKQREADIFSLQSSIRSIKQAILSCEEGDEVYVNLSTGSKLTAIAGVIACQSTGAIPIYAKPEYRDDDGELSPPDEPLTASVDEITKIPQVSLQLPTPDQQRILAYIADREYVTKKTLIKFSEAEGLSFIAETQSQSDEGKYLLLKTNIIDPLTEDGYIEVEKQGRENHVRITDDGRNILDIAPLRHHSSE